ncbi:proline-, glutamic acid- and leucine-rich protein 1 [Oryza brachyantha]|uniref:proline-, glutamic acid- and leucine-rich protein 1 n=1 Tax=Oryza brachyantha TaxID=4533 RepID=UPI001ADAF456|nr:proline-, glutamic acid- and leucine-rich protein 1 [Oryza brachyantha]
MEPEPHHGGDASLVPPAPNPSRHQPVLRPGKSTAFKREERRKRKERKRQERLALELEQWEPLSAPPRSAAASPPSRALPDTPWPCDSPPDREPSAGWGCGWGPPTEPPQPPVPAVVSTQASAVVACRAFFGEHVDRDEEEEEEEEEGNVARFFQELLEKDAGLRGFYEAEREQGRFLCLVCEGTGARAGKRFAGCAALVQHAGSVARAGRRLAHRAFADAVGRLLGWSAGRTTAWPADSGNAGLCDEADHLEDAPQSAEMEICPDQ